MLVFTICISLWNAIFVAGCVLKINLQYCLTICQYPSLYPPVITFTEALAQVNRNIYVQFRLIEDAE